MISTILIILEISVFLGIMLLAIALSFKPDSVKILGRFICSNDEKMEVLTSTASYHQPGEKSIEIYCNDYGKRRSVKSKTLLLSLLIFFTAMLPIAGLIVILIYKFIG